jgi:murein DD-endopeptidase MepM/ murein hydrolase activator NlpD
MQRKPAPYKEISIFSYPWYVLKHQPPGMVFAAGLVAGLLVTVLAVLMFVPVFPEVRKPGSADPSALENKAGDEARGRRGWPGKTLAQDEMKDVPGKAHFPGLRAPDIAVVPPPPAEPPIQVPPPRAKPKPDVIRTSLKVQPGDTIESLLGAYSVGEEDTMAVVAALRKAYNPRQLRPGHVMSISLSRPPEATEDDAMQKLDYLKLHLSPTQEIIVEQADQGYQAKKKEIPVKQELAYISATIRSSFLGAGTHAGIPTSRLMEIIKAFSYDIDFQRDIHPGDKLMVLMEKVVTEEGQFVRYGNIEYAGLKQRGKELAVFRFERGNEAGYYHADGRSVRKSLMRTPVDGARLSSGFGMRRHPILGYSKMHQGIDFAAPTGTPIYAAGDGVVQVAGRNGGYGNYIRIRHQQGFETAYAHLSGYARGMRSGLKVRQGQVIGYVGSTGRSTGPHLHYEILVGGRQVNPQQARFAPQVQLAGSDLTRFRQKKQDVEYRVAKAAREPQQMASNR